MQSTCPDAAGFGWWVQCFGKQAFTQWLGYIFFNEQEHFHTCSIVCDHCHVGILPLAIHISWFKLSVSQSVSVLPVSGGNSSPLRANKTWDPKHPKAKLLRKKSGQHFQDPDPIIFPMPDFICQYLHFLQTPYACWVLGKTSRFRGNPNWSKRPVCEDWGVHNVVLWPFKLNLHAFKT